MSGSLPIGSGWGTLGQPDFNLGRSWVPLVAFSLTELMPWDSKPGECDAPQEQSGQKPGSTGAAGC